MRAPLRREGPDGRVGRAGGSRGKARSWCGREKTQSGDEDPLGSSDVSIPRDPSTSRNGLRGRGGQRVLTDERGKM